MQNTFQLPWSRSQEAIKRKSHQCQDRPESWKSERKRCYDPGTQEWEQHSLLPWEEWRLPPSQEWKTWLLVFFVSSVWMALSLPSFFLNYFGFDTNLYIALSINYTGLNFCKMKISTPREPEARRIRPQGHRGFAGCCNWSTQTETRHYQACLQLQFLSQSFPFLLAASQQSPIQDQRWMSSALLSTFSVVSYVILSQFTDNTFPLGSHPVLPNWVSGTLSHQRTKKISK